MKKFCIELLRTLKEYQQTLKEFDYWLIFADFESYPCFQRHLTSFFVERDATPLRQQRRQDRNLMALFRGFCFNSPAAPAAGEIRVQKKRAVPDAPEAWFEGYSFMDFSLVCYLKTLPTLAGQGETKIAKTAAGFGIIYDIERS